MGTPTTKTELLITAQKELRKMYHELDVFGRPGFLYTASANAKDGDPCLVTEFIYVDDLGSILRGKKEGYSSWDSTWIPDSSFTVGDVVSSKTEQLLTRDNELTKQYQELDSEDRPVRIYEAPVNAVDGTPCLVTEYIYQNGTSTTIKGKKESYAAWDSSWVPDSDFTVSY